MIYPTALAGIIERHTKNEKEPGAILWHAGLALSDYAASAGLDKPTVTALLAVATALRRAGNSAAFTPTARLWAAGAKPGLKLKGSD